MINVLVTGGAGYIGAHCCKELNRLNYRPIVYDNLSQGHKENLKWGDFFYGDLGNPIQLKACFQKYHIDAVMHLAAYIEVGESVIDPMRYYQNNVGNTMQLLHAMIEHSVKIFVFSSSAAVYGNPQSVPIDESHPLNPINPYGKTKRIVEDMLSDCENAYGLKSIRLRYFNAAGADPEGELGEKHTPESHLIPRVLDVAARKSGAICIFGTDYPTADGTCIRDYVHVTDLACAHILALEKLLGTTAGGAYNLGQGQGFSVLEVIEQAAEITGRTIAVKKAERRPGDAPILVASNEKAVRQLSWTPEYTNLNDIIRTAWNWHKKIG
jgi:UDP-glucose 4-epimerase